MKILVDADSCPVKEIIEELARENSIELIMISNQNHCINSPYGQVVVVDDTGEAADIAIMNLAGPGDIVVTQDYGLASIVLTRGSYVIDPLGRMFDEGNIEGLLMQRYINNKARRAGVHLYSPRKRRPDDDERFYRQLKKTIMAALHKEL